MPDSAANPANPEPATFVPRPPPAWSYWLLPSIADCLFLALLGVVIFRPVGTGLLGDADTGWHIRNGELMLTTHSVTRTDPFSYTKAGQPWFAWEWLYDLLVAAIHHAAGLNGIVIFTLVLVCVTFALLFRLLLKRSGNIVVATALTLLAAAGSQVHLLARPHVLSWLFTLIWAACLYSFQSGNTRALFWLPPIMLLWVNLHGGFILGLAITAVFLCGAIWDYLTRRQADDLRRIKHLSAVFLASALVTLLTPYGYHLHVHVYEYLSSSFLMNTIDEFSSPNFHQSGYGYFEALLLIAIAACAVSFRKLTATNLFLLFFAAHAGLFAARNIPVSGILISLALAPVAAAALAPTSASKWLSAFLEKLEAFSSGIGLMEAKFRGHLLAIFAAISLACIALNGGRILGQPVLASSFDSTRFPVQATDYLAQHHIQTQLFTSDAWSGYLIYRLYPNIHLFFDDRHDFYGEPFLRQYLEAVGGNARWHEPLDNHQVNWVLLPNGWPLTSLLKESPDWRIEYSDPTAILFARRIPMPLAQ